MGLWTILAHDLVTNTNISIFERDQVYSMSIIKLEFCLENSVKHLVNLLVEIF